MTVDEALYMSMSIEVHTVDLDNSRHVSVAHFYMYNDMTYALLRAVQSMDGQRCSDLLPHLIRAKREIHQLDSKESYAPYVYIGTLINECQKHSNAVLRVTHHGEAPR